MRQALLLAYVLPAFTACSDGAPPTANEAAGSLPTASAVAAAPMLVGTRWEWLGSVTPVERIEAADPERYTLTLQADGNARLLFDCNRGSATYEIAGNKLSFGPLISTRMACPPDTQDHVFMDQLRKVRSFFIRDDQLFLEMPFDSGTLRFRAAEQ